MTTKIHQHHDLAASQLRTAVELFISGHDRFSVITLAGAADTILSQLVDKSGKTTFIGKLIEGAENEKRARSDMGKHINDVLFINALKHMDEDDDGSVMMDVEQCAFASITVAMANWVTLNGRGADFVEAFFAWVKVNLDPAVYNVDCDPDWEPSPTDRRVTG